MRTLSCSVLDSEQSVSICRKGRFRSLNQVFEGAEFHVEAMATPPGEVKLIIRILPLLAIGFNSDREGASIPQREGRSFCCGKWDHLLPQ